MELGRATSHGESDGPADGCIDDGKLWESTIGRELLVLVEPAEGRENALSLCLNGGHPVDIETLKTLTTRPRRQIYDSLFYKTVNPEVFQQ